MLCTNCGRDIPEGDCECRTFVAGRNVTVCLDCYNSLNDLGYGLDPEYFEEVFQDDDLADLD